MKRISGLHRTKRVLLAVTGMAVVFSLLPSPFSLLLTEAQSRNQVPVLDPQEVRDQDDMTWDDWKPIPHTDWVNPAVKGSDKTVRIAVITADFPDMPFVMTLPKHSDPYGNPLIDPVKREGISKFYADFWNVPGAMNHGHTIHEYWMELSRGRVGIEVKEFGPYRMSKHYYAYGGLPAADMPGGKDSTGSGNLTGELDSLWKADKGADVRTGFNLVLRIYAGYDETTVWQEFGEMKFQNKESITPPFGNPDPSKKPWVRTRYTDWTSWAAGAWLWSASQIIQGESSGSIRHEISHAAFSIGDNNNNPYVQPYIRVGAGPWDVMDRGSFNGPGGPHKRYGIPVLEGGAAPAGLLLRQKLAFKFVDKTQILDLNRNGLAKSGLAVARVMAREAEPTPGTLAGVVVRLDGDSATNDHTPPSNPDNNAPSAGTSNYSNYTLEAVQRIGYDAFTPDNGVLITKNKDRPSSTGGTNGYSVFNWIVDAHPEDINKLDFKRPDGTPVMRTMADYRQLNDAAFHAGLNSGSQFEWEDTPNRLHFYIINLEKDKDGLRIYTLGARSLDGAGPQQRGVSIAAKSGNVKVANGQVQFAVTNTGNAAPTPANAHPQDASAYLGSDIYRMSVKVEGQGWSAQLQNALAAVPFGGLQSVPVFTTATGSAAKTAKVTLTVTSESDPTKTASQTYTVTN